jgi:hypothetical protein
MKKWLLNLSLVLILPLGILLLDGCYPNDALSVGETDIVLTGYYDSVDFKTLKTYFLPDTVFPVRDDTTDKSPVPNSDLIINEIEKNMSSYGYTRVAYDPEAPEPDLMMGVAAISTTTVTVGWWYPYYPGWGWGWGWYKNSSADRDTDYWYYPGYPGYYPPGWGWGGVPYYSSYTTGTLLMELTNPNDYRVLGNDTVVPMYWAGGVHGVLSSGSNTSRISNGIDQAFTQSPYLKNN